MDIFAANGENTNLRRQLKLAVSLGGSFSIRHEYTLSASFEEGAMIQWPVAVGLKLCQKTIVEKETNNVTLVNVFASLK